MRIWFHTLAIVSLLALSPAYAEETVEVKGEVAVKGKAGDVALPKGCTATLSVLDAFLADAPLEMTQAAALTIKDPKKLPLEFSIKVPKKKLRGTMYKLGVTIRTADNKLIFWSDVAQMCIEKGKPKEDLVIKVKDLRK